MLTHALKIRAGGGLVVSLLFTPFTASAETECRQFDRHELEIVDVSNRFGLADRNGLVVLAGANRAETRVALFIIMHYRIDEACGVGGLDRPVMTYFLTRGSAPRGTSPGQDCVHFDAFGGSLYEQNGYWIFADRNQDILSLGRNQSLAHGAVSAIRTYKFSEICYIGGANGILTYFLY